MKLRSLLKNDSGNIDMILTAVIAGIVFAISIAIIYSVLGGIDYSTIDIGMGGFWAVNQTKFPGQMNGSTPALNASGSLQTNLATFYTLGPIYIVVIAAVGIIAAVMLIRGRR